MPQAAAFFDLDRTLIAGASVFPFGVEAWRAGLVSNADIARMAAEAAAFLLSGDTGEGKSDRVRSDILGRVAGVSVETLAEVGRSLLPNLVNRVRPESKNLIERHRSAGRDTWIVSASPQEIVAPLATALGMTGAIGTQGRIVDGHYTNELDGPFIYGQGKASAIASIAERHGYELEHCFAYSDSVSDLPMLDLVGHPVAVNPDGELMVIARERGWAVVSFAQRTKQAVLIGAGSTVLIGASLGSYFLGRRHGRRGLLVSR